MKSDRIGTETWPLDLIMKLLVTFARGVGIGARLWKSTEAVSYTISRSFGVKGERHIGQLI